MNDILISCIIPCYNVTQEMIYPNLSMLNNQIGIDFKQLEIILVDDCSTASELDEEFFTKFPNLSIQLLPLTENVGPGVARQKGIDIAKGSYVMFCDADDMLHSVGVLSAFMPLAKKQEYDVVYSSWLEELKQSDNTCIYVTHAKDTTWMHGKLYRKQYLTDNNIKFHDNLRLQEDTYFNGLAFALTSKKYYLESLTYIWRYREESITRNNDGEYTFNAMNIFIDSVDYLIDALRDHNVDITYNVIQLSCYIYFNLQSEHWFTNQALKFRPILEDRFKQFFIKYYNVLEKAQNDYFIKVYNGERERLKTKCTIFERETWAQFLDRVVRKSLD